MNPLLDETVFSVGGVDYRWQDVVRAAELRGDWAATVRRTREGLGLLAHAARRIDEARLEEAASAFRYARNLEAAEEAEAWLLRWGLTERGWSQWLEADLLRSESAGGDAPAGAGEEDAIDEAVLCEAVCSGELERFAERLAERAAVCAAASSEPSERHTLQQQEAAFRAFADAVATPAAVEAHLAARSLDWVRLSYVSLRFADADQAREAALSVSADGATLEDVAASARRSLQMQSAFVEDLDGGLRDRLVGAAPGSVVGPIPLGGAWVLCIVRGRRAPSLDDPQVAGRARASLVRSRVSREVANRVRWRWRP